MPRSLSSGWVLMRFGGARSPFSLIWRKISVRVELRGVVGARERLKSDPSILLLDNPEVGPWGCSVQGCFCSSRFLTIKVSTAMEWFALYIISRTMVGNLKLVGIGLSCICMTKGDLCLEFSPASSFDLVTSFCTSSSRLFTRRSCIRSESVEFDDKVSSSHGVCSSRYGAVNFSGTIEGVSDQVSGGFCLIRLGRVILRHEALLLAPNIGVTPQRQMMNHPDEVSRVRKLASVV
ncbi:hypothetical protein B296_00050877 [Ensete ventricosum]|uniref:Uncharacterized protein n=1 Tax=Ensete ventricosum TaxID=4639 RepID=A0A426Y8V3_ENSVE|nr:hypothetical protein B296_00050877 [Ensete ventricosum]